MNELTLVPPPPGVTYADYAAIEDAVMETARGRWFLLEYARRQRAVETQRLTDAVDRLEGVIAGMSSAPAPVSPEPPPANATAAGVAERLADIVWTMRERGVGDQFCAEIEKQIRIVRSLRVELETGRETAIAPAAAPAMEAPDLHEPAFPEFAREETSGADRAFDKRVAALSRLDNLPLNEKLALFC